MNHPTEIRDIASLRLTEATCLFANDFYDGAFYIAGYALELNFKAKICECLKIDDFYRNHAARSDLSRVFLVHNLGRLLILSGLYTAYETEKVTNPRLLAEWCCVLKWSETSRYDQRGTHLRQDAEDFITAVNYIIQWINLH
jgi:HEPN domain